jgi:hypothetical protein
VVRKVVLKDDSAHRHCGCRPGSTSISVALDILRNRHAATLPVFVFGSSRQLRPAASGRACLELCALASVVLVIEKSFAVSSFTHVAVAASSANRLGMSALTILTDFCLSVSEGDGVTGVVMFAPSSQDPNLSGRYSLSEALCVVCTGHVTHGCMGTAEHRRVIEIIVNANC